MSIDSQHTPGPWNIRGDAYQIVANYDADIHEGSWREHYDVVCTLEDEFGESALEARANAALIAASPALVEAVKELLDLAIWMSGSADFSPGGVGHDTWCKSESILRRAHETLAKATGGAP
jgi:hypothetical protein